MRQLARLLAAEVPLARKPARPLRRKPAALQGIALAQDVPRGNCRAAALAWEALWDAGQQAVRL